MMNAVATSDLQKRTILDPKFRSDLFKLSRWEQLEASLPPEDPAASEDLLQKLRGIVAMAESWE